MLDGIPAMMAHHDAVSFGLVSLDTFGNLALPRWRYTLHDGSVVKGIDAIVSGDGLIARNDG